MASYTTNEIRSGMKVMQASDPCVVLENDFVKPGKGQAFNRIKIRNLKTGRVVERTFKSGESLEAADVLDVEMQFLYTDGTSWHFMDPHTFEQIAVNKMLLGETALWLREQDVCMVTLWNGTPISVTPPIFVILEVIETDPGIRGDTASGGSKPAKLSTGAVVRAPLFVEEGDKLKIDTRTGTYVSRAKN